jgi:hypothetical protein
MRGDGRFRRQASERIDVMKSAEVDGSEEGFGPGDLPKVE